ncbi:MAG: sensor histidine kinase [Flavobacteriaceae bacterium]
MNLKWVILYIFCLLISTSHSQNKVIDSLLFGLNSAKLSKEKVDYLNELAWEYRIIDIDKGLSYAEQANQLSDSISYNNGYVTSLNRKGVLLLNNGSYNQAISLYDTILKIETTTKNIYGIARAQNQLGILYKKIGNLNTSIDFYNSSLKNFESLNKEKLVAKIANNLGSLYKDMGDAEKAMLNYTKSLKIREKINDKKGIAFCYLNLGVLHNTFDNFTLAIKDLKKSESLFKSLNNNFELSKIYNNLGVSYANTNDLEKALKYYKKSLLLKEKIGLENERHIILNNIGVVYEKKQDYNAALNYYQKSLVAQNGKILRSTIEVNNNLANVYRKKSQYDKALYHYKLALKASEENQLNILRLEILKNIGAIYSQQENFRLSTTYKEEYIQLQDSLEAAYKNAVLIKTNYEEEKHKNIILEKNDIINQATIGKILAENKRKTTLIYGLVVGSILLILLFFLTVKNNTQKQKILLAEKNEKIQSQKIEDLLKKQELKSINDMIFAQEQERKRIAQDLHDRLGSMLSMVKVHFKSVEENIEKLIKDNVTQYKTANNLLDEACEEVRKIAHNMSSGVLAKFGLVPALNELINSLKESSKVEIEFIDHGLGNRLENDLEINVYRIIQELFSNVLKHSKASEVSLQILKKKNRLSIIFEDNGIGFNSDESLKGMGLTNIKSRITKFDGQMDIDSVKGRGTTIAINIPI